MWAAVSAVPGGKPWKVPEKLAVATVMWLAPSRVTTNVIVTSPEPPDSALATGGTSFAGRMSAVNVGLTGVEVDGAVDTPLHALETASIAASTSLGSRVMALLLH